MKLQMPSYSQEDLLLLWSKQRRELKAPEEDWSTEGQWEATWSLHWSKRQADRRRHCLNKCKTRGQIKLRQSQLPRRNLKYSANEQENVFAWLHEPWARRSPARILFPLRRVWAKDAHHKAKLSLWSAGLKNLIFTSTVLCWGASWHFDH